VEVEGLPVEVRLGVEVEGLPVEVRLGVEVEGLPVEVRLVGVDGVRLGVLGAVKG
jgi:hypothetical protein